MADKRPSLTLQCAAVAAALAIFANAAKADSVSTSSAGGYGRLLFTFTPALKPSAALRDGVLTLSFDRKVTLDTAAVTRGIETFASTARMDPDGKALRIALSQSARLHVSSSGVQFAVDLVPASFQGTPPDLPPPPPRQAAAVDVNSLPVLKVRAGMYSSFTRLVFDWPSTTPYAVFPGSGHITLRFEAQAKADFSAITNNAPPWVKRAAWRIENRGTVVDLDIDADSGYRDFRDGTHVVLDVIAPRTDADAYNPPLENGKPGPKTRFKRLAGTSPNASNAQSRIVLDAAAQLNGTTAGNANPANASPQTAPKPAPSSPSKIAAGTQAAEPPSQAATAAQAQAAVTDSVAPDPAGTSVTRDKNGFILTIPNLRDRAVSGFVRGTTAWIVIDGFAKLDPVRLKAQLAGYSDSVDASADLSTSVVRIGLKAPMAMSIRTNGSDLKVTLGQKVPPLDDVIGFTRNDPDPKHASLLSLVAGATHALSLSDPVVGDTLIVVPAEVGHGVATARQFSEFAILPTAAGVVFTPFGDDLQVHVAQTRVNISRAGGLGLTPASLPAANTPAALAGNMGGPAFLDFQNWSKIKGGTFLEAERRLRAATAAARPEAANPARLALARFYLANKFAAEALGLVNLVQASDPALQSDMQLQTMRAAAEFMMARYRDAQSDLAAENFDTDRHASLWRGLSEAALEDWGNARKHLREADYVLGRYPADWQARVRIAEANAAIAANDLTGADAALRKLPRDLEKPLMLDAQLVRATIYARTGRWRDAENLFSAIESSGEEPEASTAIYDRVTMAIANRKIGKDAAESELERLRFRWRGDRLELKTLRTLGQLYFAQSRWREGMRVLHIASTNFPNEELAREAQDDMRTAFASLFLNGKADKMKPTDALALFYDNVELTPIGPDGDDMIRRMADRLVAMDLLGPAATLLNYQVQNRLVGIAQAQVATRLAMIDLLDHKPKDALTALRTTRIAGLPDDVNHQRIILESRALAALKQWDQALDMIGVDDASDSRQLRADIYWESGNWESAGQKIEELINARTDDAKPLSDEERHDVMRAAISYSLAGDQTGLNRLRDRYAAKMKAGPDAPAFALVTEKIDTQGVMFRDVAGKIASIDTLETFMKDFRSRYSVASAAN